jgi:flavin reductase (DIM6/NTAB) family NADH-FMN oxidoreductase RutF
MTASSFTSVSLQPPLILVCIDKRVGFAHGLHPGLSFLVNVLDENQEHLSRHFASASEDKRFVGLDWKYGWRGLPVLGGTVASFGCVLSQIVEAGDHFVLI